MVDDLVSAVLLVRKDSDDIREALVGMGVVGGHIVNFLCVEPSLGIGDIGIVCKKVDTNGDNLGTGGRDRLESHAGDDCLIKTLCLESCFLLRGEVGGDVRGKNVRGVLDIDNPPVGKPSSSGVALKHNAADELRARGCDFSDFTSGCF